MSTIHDELAERIGAHLRTVRVARGETQAEVAEALSLSVNYIGLVERGDRKLSLDTLASWCDYLGLEMAEAFSAPKNRSKDARNHEKEAVLSELRRHDTAVLKLVIQLLRKRG